MTTPTQHLEIFDEKFISLQPDGTKGWGAGLYLNDKVMPNQLKQHLIQTVINVLEEQIETLKTQNNLIMTCALSDGNEGIEWSINKLATTLSAWKELL